MKFPSSHSSGKQVRGKGTRQRSFPDPTPILLAPELAPESVAQLLHAYGLQDWKRADQNLQAMAGDPSTRKALAGILPPLLSSLSETADPDQALNEWERYIDSGIHRLQLFQYLATVPHVLDALGKVFGNSQAMAQTLIRDPFLVYWIEDDRVLVRRRPRAKLVEIVKAVLAGVHNYEGRCEALRRMKRREMLRVGIRDLLGIASPSETYAKLSDLAAVVIQSAYELVVEELQRQYGTQVPQISSPSKKAMGFSVLAMGKLGGWELNYSSDVDLIYVFQTSQELTRAESVPQSLSCEEYYHELARELTQVLSMATSEGAMFRVDMRLRPEGQVGPLICSVQDALYYYQTRGRTWERLAFLKARPIAGNLRIGQTLIKRLGGFVYGTKETAPQVFSAIHTLRRQMISKMTHRGEFERNIKLGRGGIREIEFIVQSLQLRWGYQYPSIRERQTLKCLMKLNRIGKLSLDVVQQLKASYLFLRNLENKIQMVHELQTHLLPSKIDEIAKCAIRMGYPKEEVSNLTAEHLMSAYRAHTQAVHRLYQKILVLS